jgi:hypothetical protein
VYRGVRYGALIRAVAADAEAISAHTIPPASALAATLWLSLAGLEGKGDARALRRMALQACRAADMDLLGDVLVAPATWAPELRRALGVHG